MNPNDAMVGGLKDILFVRFQVHTQFILVDILFKTFQICYYHQYACLLVCLSLLSASLSVKLQWMIQVTREIQANSSGCAVSNNLNYDSSLSLSVSVKVIPKSFDTYLNSTQCYCFKPIFQGLINEIASKQCVRG